MTMQWLVRAATGVLLSGFGLSEAALGADPCAGYLREREVKVATATALTSALTKATPGTLIRLAPGTYGGRFRATVAATADRPITLCGPREAVLDGGSTGTGYTLHLDGAKYWTVAGFTVKRGKNPVMLDRASNNRLTALRVHSAGHAGIHLRTHSKYNVVSYCEVSDTGLYVPGYGEGIYIGSAYSNWRDVTGSSTTPDRSDGNKVRYNHIGPNVAAESIDIKEGTAKGRIEGNTFDGTGMTGANYGDSWIDAKGNGYVIAGNTGFNARLDGFQTHVAVAGWGNDNLFADNLANVNGPGVGFAIAKNSIGNRVRCDNVVAEARLGFANVPCVP